MDTQAVANHYQAFIPKHLPTDCLYETFSPKQNKQLQEHQKTYRPKSILKSRGKRSSSLERRKNKLNVKFTYNVTFYVKTTTDSAENRLDDYPSIDGPGGLTPNQSLSRANSSSSSRTVSPPADMSLGPSLEDMIQLSLAATRDTSPSPFEYF